MANLSKEAIDTFKMNEPVRLNKYLSDAGFCSRREADRLIADGRVHIDGKPAELGQKVFPGQEVIADGNKLIRSTKLILIALNKPKGIECTTDRNNPDNIIDFVNYPGHIYPIGRLDKTSRGLILLTNTGELVNGILKSVNYHEKEYVVTLNKPVTDDFIEKMRQGIYLEELDRKTRECKVTQTGKNRINIVLTQGLNRQIRRMCEALDYRVLDLERIRIMNIRLGNIPEGSYRHVTESEVKKLLKELQ